MAIRLGFYRMGLCSVLALVPVTAAAQQADGQRADEDRRSVRIAAGVVSQQGISGDDSPLPSDRQLGAALSVGVRRHPTHRVGLAFETTLEPTPVKNPHFDESVSRLYLQLGPEIGRRVFVRPTLGGAVSFWSGTMSSGGVSLAPAAAVAVGYRHMSRRGLWIQPEVVIRTAAEVGAATWSAGGQIAVSLPGR